MHHGPSSELAYGVQRYVAGTALCDCCLAAALTLNNERYQQFCACTCICVRNNTNQNPTRLFCTAATHLHVQMYGGAFIMYWCTVVPHCKVLARRRSLQHAKLAWGVHAYADSVTDSRTRGSCPCCPTAPWPVGQCCKANWLQCHAIAFSGGAATKTGNRSMLHVGFYLVLLSCDAMDCIIALPALADVHSLAFSCCC